MPLQTTYGEDMPRFLEGMIPDMRTPGEDRSLVIAAGQTIKFGQAVAMDTGEIAGAWNPDKRIRAITAATDVFAGVAVLDNTQITTNGDGYAERETARVRTEGPVVVSATVAVNAGDLAGLNATGGFIVATDAATSVGRFEVTTTAANELTIVNLKGAEGTSLSAPAP